MRTQQFEIDGVTYRYLPWSAFQAVTEWGKITADLGEGVIDRLVLPGSFEIMLDALREGDTGGLEFTLRSVLAFIGTADLGERVAYYLAGAQVEAQHGNDWLPLHGDDDTVSASLEAIGADGYALLMIAWHVVVEGCRPLFDRLRSSVAAQALAFPSDSTETAQAS